FFRADNVSDALHILHTMIFGQIILPEKMEKSLNFLSSYKVSFGGFLPHLDADSNSIIALVLAFIVILYFKNSSELMENMTPNKNNIFFTALLLLISMAYLHREIKFYYFIF
ncbi:MAG: hypothetical protein P8Y35_05835, partial [Sulfurovaceae bacterium]